METTSPEIVKMRRSLEKSRQGKSYFTRLKMNEAIRAEAYRKIDELSREIHRELAKSSQENSILKSDHEQIVLNAAYLVRRAKETRSSRAASPREGVRGEGPRRPLQRPLGTIFVLLR